MIFFGANSDERGSWSEAPKQLLNGSEPVLPTVFSILLDLNKSLEYLRRRMPICFTEEEKKTQYIYNVCNSVYCNVVWQYDKCMIWGYIQIKLTLIFVSNKILKAVRLHRP